MLRWLDEPVRGLIMSGALWAGLVAITIGLSFLLWTRWGNYHLVAKCVLLSLLAHLLIGVYLATASVASAVARVAPPIKIERVEVVTADDASAGAAAPGRLPGDPSAMASSVWDRADTLPVIEPAPLMAAVDRAAPPADRKEQPALESRPRPTPRPDARPAAEQPTPQELVRSEPERADPPQTLARPPDPRGKAVGAPKETLPDRSLLAATGSGELERPPQASASEDDEAAVIPHVAPGLPSDAKPRGSASGAALPVPAARRATAPSRDETGAKPIAVPEPLRGDVSPRDAPAGPGVGLPGSPTALRRSLLGGTGTGDAPVRREQAADSASDAVPTPRRVPSSSATAAPGAASQELPVASAVRPAGPSRPGGTQSGEATRIATPEIYRNRTSPNRSELAISRGGSKASEEAVERALRWLVAHQDQDGRWSAARFSTHCPANNRCEGPAAQYRDDCATTGMALLAFLGAGNTHQSGAYTEQVWAGLHWLLSQQKPDGDLRGTGRMYSHGIATLAVSEALGMTGDAQLREPVERAVRFIVAAQNPLSGGWRYEPGQYGDTSVYGWQLMALKSAELAGVAVPVSAWQRARGWLPLVSSGTARGLASYQPGEAPTPTMTAEALVCRLFLGAAPDDAAVREAADYLMTYLPQWGRQNFYYWYYGTVGSYQVGGTHWERWNAAVRDPLVAHQRRDGHAAGSWDPSDPWGNQGGRIYATASATLCLEVYYRFLPIQSLSSSAARNPEPRTGQAPRRTP